MRRRLPPGSRPTDAALRISLCAYSSDGRPGVIPATIDVAPFSSFLICSQFRMTSDVVSASMSPNTCGWRRTSLSWMPRATPAMSKAPASSASTAWKITWYRRSPSSSSSRGTRPRERRRRARRAATPRPPPPPRRPPRGGSASASGASGRRPRGIRPGRRSRSASPSSRTELARRPRSLRCRRAGR